MTKPLEVLLLSVHSWLESLVLSAWALQSEKEVFLVNPDYPEEEAAALKLLADRLPCRLAAAPGLEEAVPSLAAALGRDLSPLPLQDLSHEQLAESFGEPDGLVFAPAGSRKDCLLGAVLAVSLGCGFLPYASRQELAGLLASAHPAAPSPPGAAERPPLRLVLTGGEDWQGKEEASVHASVTAFLKDQAGVVDYLGSRKKDYLLMVNSTDIDGPQWEGKSLGEMKVKGLSLLAPFLASFRNLFLFDAATFEPKALEIEEQVNELVRNQGLLPRYRTVMASPGYIPFVIGKNCAIGSMTEEMVRDIHIRLNDDLFFDVAEGRLFQSTPGGLSLQLLSTKYYRDLKKPENQALVVTTPHVEKGIIFATDDALIQCQLQPLLEENGLAVKLLAGRESTAAGVAAALAGSTYFLYTGHGGPETLNTHGRYLTRQDLPAGLPPVIAYASACSTTYMRPHLSSPDDGLQWDEIPIRGRDIIGLALVEKGALCFVGGATSMDLQYSTSIYGLFMDALLLEGSSVGEALLKTQNFISLYSQILMQKAPKAWRNYTYGTANALHQQILLGDPALTPCPGGQVDDFPREIREAPGSCSLRVTIPARRWRRAKAAVNPGKPTRRYYKSREMEVLSPYGAGVISWGDFYPVAPDAKGISDTSLMSSFLHVTLDLPPGEAPVSLHLTEAAAGEPECLVCGSGTPERQEALDLFRDFRLPFLMQPPLRLDMRGGWPFALEEREGGRRLHWLAPLLVIDDRSRAAYKAESLTFTLKTAPGALLRGRVKTSSFKRPASLVVTAGFPLPGEDQHIYALAQALTRKDGSFTAFCAREAKALTVDREFPLYDLPFKDSHFRPGTWPVDDFQAVTIALEEGEYCRVQGKVVDSMSAKPIRGAVLRAWRGKVDPSGDPLLEAFAGEVTTGTDGGYLLLLPPGDYIFYAAARDRKTLYKSSHMILSLEDASERHLLLALDQAARVRGTITYEGTPLPFPATVKIRRFPEKEDIETLAMVSLRANGTFEAIVSFQDRFYITVEEEGRPPVRDTNEGRGYKLLPGEVLERDYRM